MKYQTGKIKTEHHILAEFIPFLKKLETYNEISRLIPGPISRQQKGSSQIIFSISYSMIGGYRCLMKKGSTAQVLFVYTSFDSIGFENICEVLCQKFDIICKK